MQLCLNKYFSSIKLNWCYIIPILRLKVCQQNIMKLRIEFHSIKIWIRCGKVGTSFEFMSQSARLPTRD